MFGDLTTVTIGVSRGWDIVTRVINAAREKDPNFRKRADRKTWSLGVSQILTRNLLAGFDYEAITEQGYLQNPYRAIRYLASPGSAIFLTGPETYPGTRTSNAVAFRLKYFLPWHASLTGKYRYFFDTWDIHAHTAELDYTEPFLDDRLIADFTYRYYRQNSASFYSRPVPVPEPAELHGARQGTRRPGQQLGRRGGVVRLHEVEALGAEEGLRLAALRLHHVPVQRLPRRVAAPAAGAARSRCTTTTRASCRPSSRSGSEPAATAPSGYGGGARPFEYQTLPSLSTTTASICGYCSISRMPSTGPLMNTPFDQPSVRVAVGPMIVTLRTPAGSPVFGSMMWW